MAGDLTRDQIVTEVCDIVGKSVSGAAVSGASLQTRVRTYLNWAQQRIARHFNFYELTAIIDSFTLTASTKRYSFTTLGLVRPKDIRSVLLLDSQNSFRMYRMQQVNYEKRFPRPENFSTGRPRIYVRIGDNLEFFYIPDSAYTIKIIYPQWPTPFTTAGQVSDFSNKDQLLVVATVMETYLALEEYTDATAWFNKMLGMLNDAVRVEGDVDWEPQAEPIDLGMIGTISGAPWMEPGAMPDDPLYGYPNA